MQDIDRYLFLASAVAGRRMAVHRAAGRDTLACSDGHSIMLPPVSAAGTQPDWRDVIAQACLTGAGSLEPRLLRKLVGRPDAARRYCFLEVRRAATVLTARLPSAFLQLPELGSGPQVTATCDASLDWALSRRPLPEPPGWFGTVRPLMTLRKAVQEDGLSALTQREASGDFKRQEMQEFDDDDATEESKLLKLFENPLFGNNPLSDMLNKILGAGTSGKRSDSQDGGGGAEAPVGRIEQALRRGIHAVRAHLPFELPDVDTSAEAHGYAYPEWNVYDKVYRPNWALVDEVDAWRPDGPRDLSDVLKPASPELHRQLGRLGLDHEMHRRQTEGSELDSNRLIDCAIDLATGHSPPTLDVYAASRRTRRDLAVVVALDISGSTAERAGDGPSIFDRQLQVAYQLARTLSQLGDRVELFGFHSWGRNLVRSVRLKGAEEPWSGRVTQRMAQLEPVGYTRTGAIIRHGGRKLKTGMRLPHRLFILITDGIAYDQDYEAAYAEADARKALEEVAAEGTACVCLCIGGSQQADKLQAVFGSANVLMVDEPEQVTARIRKVCQQALAARSQRKLKRAAA